MTTERMTLVKTAGGRPVAQMWYGSNGDERLFQNGRTVGRYIKCSGVTVTAEGRVVGQGNVLGTLIDMKGRI